MPFMRSYLMPSAKCLPSSNIVLDWQHSAMGGNDLLSCSGDTPSFGQVFPNHGPPVTEMDLLVWSQNVGEMSRLHLQMLMCHTRKQESLQQIHPCLLLQVGGSKIRIKVSEQIFRSLSACHVCGCINLKKKTYLSPPAQAKRLQWIHFPRLRFVQHGNMLL